MKIEVGMYVRTKDGIIKRVSSYNPQENNPLWETLNGNVQMKGTITKHSKDIIDLIEVGDYVNGEKVVSISLYRDDDGTSYWCTDTNVYDTENYKIKSILTHEQYEANCYKVAE